MAPIGALFFSFFSLFFLCTFHNIFQTQHMIPIPAKVSVEKIAETPTLGVLVKNTAEGIWLGAIYFYQINRTEHTFIFNFKKMLLFSVCRVSKHISNWIVGYISVSYTPAFSWLLFYFCYFPVGYWNPPVFELWVYT